MKSLALKSLDFEKEFILYTFPSDTSYAIPVSFMSSNLERYELKYPDVEKQGFAIFKAFKHFKPYLLKAQIMVIVPHPT